MKRTLAILAMFAIIASIISAQQIVFSEDFNGSTSLPAGWVDGTDMGVVIQSGIGVGGTNALKYNVYGIEGELFDNLDIYSPVVNGLPVGATLTFEYRVMAYNSSTTAGDFGNSAFKVYFTPANMGDGQVVWQLSDHATSTAYRTISIPLNTFAGLSGRVRFFSQNSYEEDFDLHLDNVKIETTDTPPEYDLVAVSVTGDVVPIINQPYEYTITVRNIGSSTVAGSAYSVSLMQVGNPTPIGTQNGSNIAPDTNATFIYTYTPTVIGNAQLYGVVAYAQDENQDNNTSANLNINVRPSNTVYIGNPTSVSREHEAPFNLYWKQSLVQTIYYENEIGRVGQIQSISYNFSRGGSTPGNNGYSPDPLQVKVYMATTQQTSFDNVQMIVPFSEFTLVYQGAIPVNVAGVNNITIQLQTPFEYYGDNLVVMTLRNYTSDFFADSNTWRITPTPNIYRTLSFYSDPANEIIVPLPNGDYPAFMNEFPREYLANITLTIEDIAQLDFDLRAASITGYIVPLVNRPYEYTVTVRNMGALAVAGSAYNVSLMQVGNPTPIATQNGTELAPDERGTFAILYTPTTAGEAQLYGLVTYAADEDQSNNQTTNLLVTVQPEGEVYIGNPASFYRMSEVPFSLYWRQSLAQTIYYEAELQAGIIYSIGYNFQRGGDVPGQEGYPEAPKRVKIYMKTTDQSIFANHQSFIPYNGFVLVYDGTIPVDVAGVSDIEIQLDTPFAYESGNLVVMTQRVYSTIWHTSTNTWQNTATIGLDRTIFFRADDNNVTEDISQGYPTFTSNNTLVFPYVPNTRLHFLTGGLASLTGTVITEGTGTALQGALLSLNGTSLSTLTNAQGEFAFPYVPVGTIGITATKLGYYPLTRDDIHTSEGQTAVIYLQMTPLPGVAVTITVQTYDNAPTTGATVILQNSDTVYQETLTTDNVVYLPSVVQGIYTLTAQKEGYYPYVTDIEVGGEPVSVIAHLGGVHTIFYEGFDDLSVDLPFEWTHITNYPDHPWYINNETHSFTTGTLQPLYYYAHNESEGMAISASYVNEGPNEGPLDPNNWLITPSISIPGDSYGARLEYFVTTWAIWADHYGVYLSTTGNNMTDFTLIFEETPPGGSYNNQVWTPRTIDLAEYIGQRIYIAFRHYNSFDCYFLMLDDVRVVVSSPTSIGDEVVPVVSATGLKGNYPNPFNPSTTIAFDVAHEGRVVIDVYNIKGQRVRSLVNGVYGAGTHNVVWNGCDEVGRSVGSGVYFYRMSAGRYVGVRKMVMVK